MFRQRQQNWLDNPVFGWLILIVVITLVSGGKVVEQARNGGKITIAVVVAILVVLALWLR